ncbi:stability/partitioning determinant [Methylobacterium radiotolerans]|uniref:stability/partitioning determinant n=1 Tax=Methylobacterium radiotolerans TaxID=31998 RepID=UPI0015F35688|nr:stability/partitioning determinant [Methylobacterium radiotolerans]
MTTAKNDRPSLGFGGELDGIDLANFPSSKAKAPKPKPETARIAAEAAGFRSRESRELKAEPARVQQRRRRTGRTAQLNLKLKPETIEAFTRIADAKGWGLGEAFERATALLERDVGSS